eukprot:TRINITY_DN3513_c0_g1_i1.p1 TRINITY_DN3513_c0_g1~~TRINITY_DN3513_c0_g1_i1.p1  ORF type:complete len:119 (-),score=93.91 TRINITY_DN3513_c0_g1_i1:82-438(-)
MMLFFFFFQAEDGIRDLVRSRGLGDVYKRQKLEDASAVKSTDKEEKNAEKKEEQMKEKVLKDKTNLAKLEGTISAEKGKESDAKTAATKLEAKAAVAKAKVAEPVSYTHLTLPTIYSV